MHKFDVGVIWCYSDRSAEIHRQLPGTKNDCFKQGVPADVDKAEENPSLKILDELLTLQRWGIYTPIHTVMRKGFFAG